MGLYLSGRISEGMACTIEMVESVVPISIPPPTSAFMDVGRAEMAAPARAMSGGNVARYFRSSTSERLPRTGESTACMRSGV